ncbi:SDR family oxidoreductase [Nocardioides sp.]|uniref:SDR family oxidoreductase n=1 Tax=Nocardioides sp. TaxID=35761 RepID=UPI0026239E30|nr:SDR family oxidoreductase [Nocardioides sp.]MDI6912331.1 SDR family oxidoreductase [Nocardioides sp.]
MLAGRVAVVTGAGRGIGCGHALELARQGARVVVNDLGFARDGTGAPDPAVAEAVVEEIRAAGGQAVSVVADAADGEGARSIIDAAVDTFGRLDVVVNNAGVLRDRMMVNLLLEDWDAVIRGHLRSTFAVSQAAAVHWRAQAKAGEPTDARIINTSSPSGLYGNVGQANYGAAKAGIAAFTVISAMELQRYGVTVNAIAPIARTRMTDDLGIDLSPAEGEFDVYNPDNVAPLIAWLASSESGAVTGRVFNIVGGKISLAIGWQAGPETDVGARWEASEIGPAVEHLLAAMTNDVSDGYRIDP